MGGVCYRHLYFLLSSIAENKYPRVRFELIVQCPTAIQEKLQ